MRLHIGLARTQNPLDSLTLRITVVSPFIDRKHGTERVLAELLARLARKYGCVIHIYSQKVNDLEVQDPRCQISNNCGGIYWHRIPSIPGPHLVQFVAWLVTNTCWRLWDKHIRGHRYDLLLSPGINCLDADVIIVHALFHRVWALSQTAVPQPTRLSMLRRLHRTAYYSILVQLEKLIYGHSRAKLAAVSHRTATLLKETFGREGVRVLPNAVDLAVFSPEERRSRRNRARLEWGLGDYLVLLFIGNDWTVKGLSTLLEAISACRDRTIKLLVAGADEPGPFREIADRLRLLDRVTWVKPRADVMSLYAAADLYVGPSREDAFALPPLEAMACGLPVVTSSCNGGAEVIEDGVDGFVLRDPTDSLALAKILDRLAADMQLRERVGTMASLTAKGYTWERNAAETWEFLKDVAATSSRSGRE